MQVQLDALHTVIGVLSLRLFRLDDAGRLEHHFASVGIEHHFAPARCSTDLFVSEAVSPALSAARNLETRTEFVRSVMSNAIFT